MTNRCKINEKHKYFTEKHKPTIVFRLYNSRIYAKKHMPGT